MLQNKASSCKLLFVRCVRQHEILAIVTLLMVLGVMDWCG